GGHSQPTRGNKIKQGGKKKKKNTRHDKIRQGHRQHGGKGAEVIDWAILVHRGTDAEGQAPHERHGECHPPQVQRHRKGLADNLVHSPVLIHVRTAKIPTYSLARKITNCCQSGLSRPYCFAMLRCASGLSGWALSATGSSGLPGVRCMMVNVISAMASSVGTIHKRRRIM